MVLLLIPVVIVCLLIGFYLGVRYATGRMLATYLARMSEEDLNVLAAEAGRLRGQ